MLQEAKSSDTPIKERHTLLPPNSILRGRSVLFTILSPFNKACWRLVPLTPEVDMIHMRRLFWCFIYMSIRLLIRGNEWDPPNVEGRFALYNDSLDIEHFLKFDAVLLKVHIQRYNTMYNKYYSSSLFTWIQEHLNSYYVLYDINKATKIDLLTSWLI